MPIEKQSAPGHLLRSVIGDGPARARAALGQNSTHWWRLSFVHAVRVVRRKLLTFNAISRKAFHEGVLLELLQERLAGRRGRRNPRAVVVNFTIRRRFFSSKPRPLLWTSCLACVGRISSPYPARLLMRSPLSDIGSPEPGC